MKTNWNLSRPHCCFAYYSGFPYGKMVKFFIKNWILKFVISDFCYIELLRIATKSRSITLFVITRFDCICLGYKQQLLARTFRRCNFFNPLGCDAHTSQPISNTLVLEWFRPLPSGEMGLRKNPDVANLEMVAHGSCRTHLKRQLRFFFFSRKMRGTEFAR